MPISIYTWCSNRGVDRAWNPYRPIFPRQQEICRGNKILSAWVRLPGRLMGNCKIPNFLNLVNVFTYFAALAITPSHQQNTHVFADGRKNMNATFNNYVCSASHLRTARTPLSKCLVRALILASYKSSKGNLTHCGKKMAITRLTGWGPTGLRAWVRNRSQLVPKTGFQDGCDRTRIFTHNITILA